MQPAEQPATQAPVGCKGNQFSCQDKMSQSGMYIISASWHHNNQQHNQQHAHQRITVSALWCCDAFMLYFRTGCLLCFVSPQQPGAVQLHSLVQCHMGTNSEISWFWYIFHGTPAPALRNYKTRKKKKWHCKFNKAVPHSMKVGNNWCWFKGKSGALEHDKDDNNNSNNNNGSVTHGGLFGF